MPRVRRESASLRAAGGLFASEATLLYPSSLAELEALFVEAGRAGERLTLVGSQRSFGQHFLPSAGARGVVLSELAEAVTKLEETASDVWVRVSGATSFEALCRAVPGTVPFHPPTGDRISVGGAFAACSHDVSDYLARDVRSFRLLAPNGRLYECARGKPGIEGELFEHVPGSFGALGAVLDLELRLRRIRTGECVEVCVVDRRPTAGYGGVSELERCYRTGEYALGRGLFFFGRRGPSVLLGDRIVVAEPGERLEPLLLLEDATERNIVAQALANRWPLPSQRLQLGLYEPGRRSRAELYAFCFYQRSYDRAQEYLAGPRIVPRLLRGLGVDPWLGVCHQSYAIPIDRSTEFLDLYFATFDLFADLESRLEQQDLIRLPPCPWPLHGAYGMADGCYLLTTSLSVRRGERTERRARAFFTELSRRAFERLAVPVLLLKQAHADTALLRVMHRGYIERLGALKRRVDPERVLGSVLLERLGVA
jgi:hypothetical protein